MKAIIALLSLPSVIFVRGSVIFDFKHQASLDLSFAPDPEFFEDHTDPHFSHLYQELTSTYLLPQNDENTQLTELYCKLPILHDTLQQHQESQSVLKLGISQVEAPKFQEINDTQLLGQLYGRCFEYNEDIWLYKFCVGDSVGQYHVEANGTFSEEFNLGKSTLQKTFEEQASKLKEESMIHESLSDDPLQDFLLFNEVTRFMSFDPKSSGYIVRVFDTNQTQPRLKHDMIALQYPDASYEEGFRTETRVIISVINDYTFILDKPFDNWEELPSKILDFKYLSLLGKQRPNDMSSQDQLAHQTSYGLELIHARFAYCKRCQFTQTQYRVGDNLVFEYYDRVYSQRIVRIIEENLIEVEILSGNDQHIVIVDKYHVIDREAGSKGPQEWKNFHKKQPRVTLKGGKYLYSEENLSTFFREGDQLIFLDINSPQNPTTLKNRKYQGSIFTVQRFINDGFGLELSNEHDLLFPEESIQVEYSKNYLIAKDIKKQLPQPWSNEVSKFKFGQGNRKMETTLFKTNYSFGNGDGIITFQAKAKKNEKNQQKLRFTLGTSQNENLINFIYNQQHGILLNDNYQDIQLFNDNATKIYLIIHNQTLYISEGSPKSADILLTRSIGDFGGALNLYLDIGYSSDMELSQLEVFNGPLSPKVLSYLSLYHTSTPISPKSYMIETYLDGTVCAVNQRPREVTVFYYCDYFSQSEFQVLELSEPEWCRYHVKVVTKYLCGNTREMRRREENDVRFGKSKVKCMPRSIKSQ